MISRISEIQTNISTEYKRENKTSLEVIGPGIWFNLHIKGIRTIDGDQKKIKILIEEIEELKQTFPFEKCRNHLNDYCNKYPIENAWKLDSNNMGYFKWTWMLHNIVNLRLGKTTMSYETSVKLYTSAITGESGCAKVCKG